MSHLYNPEALSRCSIDELRMLSEIDYDARLTAKQRKHARSILTAKELAAEIYAYAPSTTALAHIPPKITAMRSQIIAEMGYANAWKSSAAETQDTHQQFQVVAAACSILAAPFGIMEFLGWRSAAFAATALPSLNQMSFDSIMDNLFSPAGLCIAAVLGGLRYISHSAKKAQTQKMHCHNHYAEQTDLLRVIDDIMATAYRSTAPRTEVPRGERGNHAMLSAT